MADKQEKILSGEVDVGRPICPITRVIYRERPYQQTVDGRVISLSEIRKRHLTQMQNMGLLRDSRAQQLTKQECHQILSSLKGLYSLCLK